MNQAKRLISNKYIKIGAVSIAVLPVLAFLVVTSGNKPSVVRENISAGEIEQVLGEEIDVREDGSYSMTDEQITKYIATVKRQGSDQAELAKAVEMNVNQLESRPDYAQAYISTKAGGQITTDNVKVNFPAGAVTEDVVVTYRSSLKQGIEKETEIVGKPFSLTASTLYGEPVSEFQAPVEIKVDTGGQTGLSAYYYDQDSSRWVGVESESRGGEVVAITNHFTDFVVASAAPVGEEEEEYPYEDCGRFIDDSFVAEEHPNPEIDRSECFRASGPWELSDSGAKKTSLYSNSFSSTARWYPDYKSLDGTIEVLAVVPDITELWATPENPEPGEYASQVRYFVYTGDTMERVEVDLTQEIPGIVSLGDFDFTGEDSRVLLWGLTSDEAAEGKYIVADAVCFGQAACEGVGDITPPLIEDVKATTIGLRFLVQAKITDSGSGVGTAYVLLNGTLYPMNPNGDIYSVMIPITPGVDLDYQIIAYDKSGNESIWDPTRGYISRSTLSSMLGVPPWAFYMGKDEFSYIPSANAGSSFCNQFCGDPINTANGNLYESIKLVEVGGRPEIELTINYNSQGSGLTIFGESWNHSYNYHLIEFDNVDFQGAVVTYPGGRQVVFEGAAFTPEPGNFEELVRVGDSFELSFKDLTKVTFDIDGDVTRIEDANGNGLNFTYGEKLPYVNMSQLTKIEADGGRSIEFTYDSVGLVHQIIAPEGKTITLEHDGQDDLVTYTDGRGNNTHFEYENHSIIRKITPAGHPAYVNTYDDQRRVTQQVAGTGFTQDYAYEEGESTVTDLNGTVATYEYTDGVMTALIDERGEKMTYEYNEQKQVVKSISPDGNETTYEYDELGNRVLETDALGQEVVTEYDEVFNKPIHQVYKQADHVTDWSYDDKGNLLGVVNAFGDKQEFTYSSFGQLLTSTDYRGNKTHYGYNSFGDLVSVVNAEGNVSEYSYDGLGRKVGDTNPRDYSFGYEYDKSDNLVKVSGPLGYNLGFEYDPNGHLIKEIDPNGGMVTYDYDKSENMVSVTDQLGNTTEFVYDDMNSRRQVTDAEGRVAKLSYNPSYDVKQVISAAGSSSETVSSFNYNGMRLQTRAVDGEGRISRFEYDPLYRLAKQIEDAQGIAATSEFEYSPTGALTKVTDAEGNATEYRLDKLDRIRKITDAEGNEQKFEYDKNGNVVKYTDAKGLVTEYSYDKLNRLIAEKDALDQLRLFAYDQNGNLVENIAENGVVTHFEYDSLDRLVTRVEASTAGIINPLVNMDLQNSNIEPGAEDTRTEFSFDLAGSLTEITNPRGYKTAFTYDAAHRQITVTDSLGSKTNLEYDKVGNLIKATDRNGNSTDYKYDALNRLATEINAEGHKTRYSYDRVGNLVNLMDRRGNSTNYTYNGIDQLVKQTDALSGVSKFKYDLMSNLLQYTDENGHAVAYSYDDLYRLTQTTNPEGHAQQFKYDPNSNLVSNIDANGNLTRYRYDDINRQIKRIDALSGVMTYGYDPVGNVLSMNDENSHVDRFSYDALDRVVTLTDAELNTTRYAYDQNSNTVLLTDANGNPTSYTYDELDRMVSNLNAEGEETQLEYDKETNIIAEIAADGVKTAYDYDGIYRLVDVSLNDVDGGGKAPAVNVNTQYKYDANDNLISIIDPKGNATKFGYDKLNRQVKEINALNNSWSYGYDPADNRVSKRDANGHTTTYSYYADDQLNRVNYYDGTKVSYSYDANNNQVSMSDSLGITISTYDALNRATNVNDSLARALAYDYDAVGNTTSVTYPDGKVVNYGYLKNDWLENITDPESLVTNYQRDHVGNVLTQTNPNNTTATYEYDRVYRPTNIVNQQVDGKLNSSFAYTYDNVGQRTQVDQYFNWRNPSEVTETYAYDPVRRLIESTTSQGIVNNYTYDRAGNRIGWVSTDDEATPKPFDEFNLEYSYDAINAVQWIREPGEEPQVQGTQTQKPKPSKPSVTTTKPQTKTITHTKKIPQKVAGFIDGVHQFLNHLEAQEGKNVSANAFKDLMKQVNELNNLAEKGLLIQSVAQNRVNKLEKAINDYLASGDIKAPGIANSLITQLKGLEAKISTLPVELQTETTTETITIPGQTIVTPGASAKPGQVLGAQEDINQITFNYDKNGNRIAKEIHGPQGPEDQLTKYKYDPEDRLANVTVYQRSNQNKWTVRDVTTMDYDGAGRRLERRFDPKQGAAGVKLDEYVYNGLDPVAVYNMQNGQYENMYRDLGLGSLVGQDRIISSQHMSSGTQGQRFWFEYDALGSVVGTSKHKGQSEHNYRYEDFGQITPDNGNAQFGESSAFTSPHNAFTFTGQEYDGANNLYEFYSRAYDPEVGVWLQQDRYRGTIRDPRTLHRIMYTFDNPINYYDSDGYFVCGGICVGAVFVGVASLAAIDIGLTVNDLNEVDRIRENPDSTPEELQYADDLEAITFASEMVDLPIPIIPLDDLGRYFWKRAAKPLVKNTVEESSQIFLKRILKDMGGEVLEDGTVMLNKKLYANSWQEAEQLLAKEFGTNKNTTKVFCEGMSKQRIPDFITDDMIADAKWYDAAQLTNSQQLRDFATYAASENKPLYVYVRGNTNVSQGAIEVIESTGGSVIRIFE